MNIRYFFQIVLIQNFSSNKISKFFKDLIGKILNFYNLKNLNLPNLEKYKILDFILITFYIFINVIIQN